MYNLRIDFADDFLYSSDEGRGKLGNDTPAVKPIAGVQFYRHLMKKTKGRNVQVK